VTGDPRRLSGMAIIDPGRSVRWLYRSRLPGDYPPIQTVLDALARGAKSLETGNGV
jgi:hypothetical protein